MALDLSGNSRKKAKRQKDRVVSAKVRREQYFKKAAEKRYDDFTVTDLQFFFRDLFMLKWGKPIPTASGPGANKVFSDLKGQHGFKDTCTLIAASFSLGEGPDSIWYFQRQKSMATLVRDLEHYRRLSDPLMQKWYAYVQEQAAAK